MKYSGTIWESAYKNAWRLFENAKGYYDMNAKSRELKRAWNAAFGLPDDYEGRQELMYDIDDYARSCGIDLSEVTGY